MRIQNIEFLRFLFALVIILFHGGHTSPDGYLAVEMFFVLAGYFLGLSATEPLPSTGVFMRNKAARLWPLFAFAVVIAGGNLYDMLFKLLFLHATGLTLKYQGFIWFVAPFFWSMVIYFIILKHYGASRSVLPVSLLVYVCYVLLVNYDGGNFNVRQTVNSVFSLAFVRAVGGIGFGILLVPLFAKIRNILPAAGGIKGLIFIGIMEAGLLFFLLFNMVFHHLQYNNKLIFVVFFAVELFLFVERRGFVSRFFDCKFWGFMGRYAYAVYIMQALGLKIAAKINQSFLGGTLVSTTIEVFVVLGLGILGYHFIERPAYARLAVQTLSRHT